MKAHALFSPIEPLEARIAPATLDVTAGGLLTYTAGAGISNSLTLSIAGANYSFNDTGETIALTAAATTAGFTGGSTNTVQGPNTAVTSITVNLGDLGDQFDLQALTDPFTIFDGAGTDSVFVTGAVNVGGALFLSGEAITVNAAISGATTATLAANAISLGSTIAASMKVTLQPLTATNDINLGAADAAGVLGLTDAEIDRITAPVLQIGVAAGTIDIIVSAAITPANVSTLRLLSTNTITDGAAGSIVVPNLAVTSTNSVTLDNAGNNVGTLAASVTAAGADFGFRDANDLIIGTVDGISGITVGTFSTGEDITLQAGATTQTAGASIRSSGLTLLGAGPFTLNEAGNDVTLIAANITGTLSYTDADSLNVASLGATFGVTTVNNAVSIATISGNITVFDTKAGADINAGSGVVSLTAGSVGAEDNTVTIQANAGVTGTGGVTLSGDNMSIAAAVNAGTGVATLQPAQAATLIDLGGADAANTLGLTDAEIDFVTAGILRIGLTNGAAITVTAAITPANTSTLSLRSVGNVLNSGAGALQVANLAVVGNGVNLDSATNQVATIAGTASGSFATVFNFVSASALTVGTVDGFTGITTFNGGVTLSSDSMTISNAIVAPNSHVVTLQPVTAARPLDLGTETAGSLSLTDTELDRITAGVLRLGRTTSGAIAITALISPSVPTLSLISGATITDSGAGAVTATNLRLTAATGVTLDNVFNNAITLLAGSVTGVGSFTFTDTNASNIGVVDGVTGITAANGNITVTTQSGSLTLSAPVAANTAGNTINLTAAAAIADGNAASVNATATNLSLSAAGGIGTAADPIETSVSALEARTVTGGIFIANSGTVLNIGGVTAVFEGVQATTSGDIQLTNNASIIAGGTATEIFRTPIGNILIQATGATSNIETRAGGVTVLANSGTLTFTAGQDILLGSAATDKVGSIDSSGSMVLSAGRDIIFDENTNVFLFQSGTFTATAGRNFSLLASDGTVGSKILTPGGAIAISTGAGGIFTSTAGSATGMTSNGGPITISADQFVLTDLINAGAGIVTIQPVTANRPIDVGGADSAGTMGLTDAELDLVTAGVLRIGNGTAGTVSVSAAITLGVNVPTLTLSGSTLAGAGSVSVANLRAAATGSITLNGANDVDTLAVNVGSAFSFADADGFTIGPVDGDLGFLSTGADAAAITTGGSGVAFANSATLFVDLNGTTPGTLHDQLAIIGAVDLGGATLAATLGGALALGDEFIILTNDGTDAVAGNFAGAAEGAPIILGGRTFFITYAGGDGNDVALSIKPLAVTLSANKKSATFTDVDGDLVTVKTNKGVFDGSEFLGIQTAAGGAGQFQTLKLDADFKGANITITAKRTTAGGNGFVNLGFLDANGVDLGAVSLAGDLGRIAAGTVGGDVKVPGVKSLAVQSIGMLGSSTQTAGGNTDSILEGALPKLTVKGDLRATLTLNGATDGKLGAATIGGSFTTAINGGSTLINAAAGIVSLKIGGDIRGSATASVGISTAGAIGTLSVGGGIVGTSAASVQILAFGQLPAPTKGSDVALKSLNVRGSVEFAFIGLSAGNADASIGTITVGGDWIASTVLAGVTLGADFAAGTADDAKSSGRDKPAIFSSIGSFTVKGQALGTATPTTDMFGIVAERIGKAKVGGRTFAFKADVGVTLNREAFFAAPTLDGAGAENPMFDFTIRELGSLTPVVALGGANLDISSDGKTATFTDVDGDLVTVKRSAGAFLMGDITITAAASGGGLLQALTITPAPDSASTNLSITAKVGPGGGNGFVNVGKIDADQTDLGVVIIGGELQDLDVGDNDSARLGLGSLTVHSLGAVAGTSPNGDEINSAHGIGKIAVATDIRSFHIFANSSDSGNLGSITVGGAMLTSEIQAAANIGTIKIGGSFTGSGRIQATERIGAISIGGDLIGGGGTAATIEAFAQDDGPAKGLDLALKSLTVKGSVEKVNVILGRNNNADASIGAISVGRTWLASSVLAGVEAGVDTFIGTADDRKVSQGGPTDLARFSTIASIVIKGQAFGSTAAGDTFGIVAEQIVKVQIGKVKFALNPGERDAADVFALAPTGPGTTGLASDFFLREIIV